MLVPMLAFPWGMAAQAAIALPLAIGYLAVVPWTQLATASAINVLIGTLIGISVSIGGAWLLDQQRRATFVERHRVEALAGQKDRLLEVSRQLNGTMDVDALAELVTRLSRALLDCDVASLALAQPNARAWRMVAVSRDRDAPTWRAFGAEDRVAAVANSVEGASLVELSTADPSPEIRDFLTRHGLAVSLIVAVERDGRRLGMLSFNHHRPGIAFTASQRQLASGIAHQAAIALANARLVEDLQQASRIKSEFVSTMSHELRTPLNVILGFTEMARDLVADQDSLLACLGKIDAAGRDLLDLIEGTLALGKLEAKRDAVILVATPLPPLWTSLRDVCERFPRAGGVALEWSEDPPPVALATDPQKLAIVVRNLVGNALKFTLAGRVAVQATRRPDGLAITVADTGIGIRPEDQARVFEMFQQADGSDARRFGGTGLGLYIVRQYVEQLRGSITLESAPGRGTTFTVVLPVTTEPIRDAA
jgi:signal transduction histidine kinase